MDTEIKDVDFVKSATEAWIIIANKEKSIKSMRILKTLHKAGYKSALEKIFILKQIKLAITENSPLLQMDGIEIVNKKVNKLIGRLNIEEPYSKRKQIIKTIKTLARLTWLS
jgi:hypothetical protein